MEGVCQRLSLAFEILMKFLQTASELKNETSSISKLKRLKFICQAINGYYFSFIVM